MITLTVNVTAPDKAELLAEILSSLDFVIDVSTKPADTQQNDHDDETLFDLFGMWHDYDITIESLRRGAWPDSTQ